VVTDDDPGAPSRRALLGGTAGGAAAAVVGLLSACGSASHSDTSTSLAANQQPIVRLLNHALDLKHYVVGAYTAATPLLRGRNHAAAKRFLAHDLSHVSELISLIKRAGGTPNEPQPTYNLGHPHGPSGILRLLDEAENATIAAYLDLLPEASPGYVRAALGAILANDAQHVAVLRLALRRDPIPEAFVRGHA